MKTRIGTSFGLALLLALGVIGAMLALGTFSAPKAEADVDTTARAANPVRAGSASQISISFRHQNILTAGTGQITVVFDSRYGFPAAAGTLPRTAITLTTGQATGGTSNPAVDPTYTSNAAGDKTVVITIDDTTTAVDRQDMFPNASCANAAIPCPNGSAGAATGASAHTLVFGTAAGITLPTGANAAATNFITLTVGAEIAQAAGNGFDGAADLLGIATARTMELSSITGGAGTAVTITGYGFTTGLTPRVYIDFDDSGTFTVGDTDLQVASTPAIAGGTFTRTFTVDTTRFTVVGGVGNPISADDGVGNVAGAANVNWILRGTVTTDKASATRGETVQVRLRQFGAGPVRAVTFGGAGATIPVAQSVVPASGTLNIDIVVPTTTTLGTQRVSVTADGEAAARTVNIDVVGTPLTLSPSTAVPRQDITVSGSGFNGGSVIGPITIGGIAVAAVDINNNAAVTADNSGNMVTTVKVSNNAVTRAAGTTTLIVTDALFRTGQATLTIPSRGITLSPASSRRGTTVTVTGTGFPSVDTVAFTYGAALTAIGSATTDSVGNFTHTFTVPTGAVIPSTNVVTADPQLADVANAVANHSVPGATVTVDQASASPGNTITVTGTGFPGFTSMDRLDVGTVSALPTPGPSTDANGNFSTTALVPQVALGTLAVTVRVGGAGGTTATTSLTIVAAPVVVAPVVPVVVAPVATATTFAAVIAQADNLVRVWRYSNATQSWSFYDPRPAFAAANTLANTSSGNIVWVNIKVQQTFQGQTLFPGWNLISLQ